MQGGPRMFSQSSTASDLLDRRRSPVVYRTVTFCGRPFQSVRLSSQRRMARGHGLIRFRSPLLTESRLISFPPGTEMFQFPGFAPDGLCIQPPVTPAGCPVAPGCPIRKSPDQSLFGGSPELFAAYNVLHRLCTPRHPPYTLSSLTTFMKRCGQDAPSLHCRRSGFLTREPSPPRPASSRTPNGRRLEIRFGYPFIPTYSLVTDRATLRPRPAVAGFQAPVGAQKRTTHRPGCRSTGADRDRTGNLRVANAALSQLSYGPGAIDQVTPSRTCRCLRSRRRGRAARRRTQL